MTAGKQLAELACRFGLKRGAVVGSGGAKSSKVIARGPVGYRVDEEIRREVERLFELVQADVNGEVRA